MVVGVHPNRGGDAPTAIDDVDGRGRTQVPGGLRAGVVPEAWVREVRATRREASRPSASSADGGDVAP